jgi:2-C-methyl-D-erythritol 4-phosphate cytidylyltransferase
MKICAVIVAAGSGTRMGGNINKQFIKINEKPLLYYTLKAFSDCIEINEIIVVLSPSAISYFKEEIIDKYNIKKVVKIIEGGKERQESVYKGLKSIKECDIVLIHDGARPFVTNSIIHRGIEFAKIHGASACGVMPKDTVKIKDSENFSLSTPDRKQLFLVQTPQCFTYSILRECHEKFCESGSAATDDTMIVEKYGYKVYLYEGDYENIKITTPEDVAVAEVILSKR